MPRSSRPVTKGQCADCLGIFTLKKDGTMHAHFALVTHTGCGYETNKCPGSGEPPRERKPLWR